MTFRISNTNFLKVFLSVLGFSKGILHFFPKVLKKWSSCPKNDYHFLGEGGVRAKSDKNHFFGPFKIFQMLLRSYWDFVKTLLRSFTYNGYSKFKIRLSFRLTQTHWLFDSQTPNRNLEMLLPHLKISIDSFPGCGLDDTVKFQSILSSPLSVHTCLCSPKPVLTLPQPSKEIVKSYSLIVCSFKKVEL